MGRLTRVLQNKGFLMVALLTGLSSSLSWNPQYFTIARHEFVRSENIELAASSDETAAPTEIKLAGKLNGVTSGGVVYQTSKNGDDTVVYYNCFSVRGLETGTGCSGKITVAKDTNSKAIEDLILKQVADQLKLDLEGEATGSKKGRRESLNSFETECGETDNVLEVLDCRQSEYETYARECKEDEQNRIDAANEKIEKENDTIQAKNDKLKPGQRKHKKKAKVALDYKECKRELERYYNKFLRSVMGEACKGGIGTQAYQTCKSVIRGVVGADLKPNSSVMDSMFGNVFSGVINQAYNMCGLGNTNLGMGFMGQTIPGMFDMNRFQCMQQYAFQNGQMVGMDLFNSLRSVSMGGINGNLFGMQYQMGLGDSAFARTLGESFQRSFTLPYYQFNRVAGLLVDNKTPQTIPEMQRLVAPYIGVDAANQPNYSPFYLGVNNPAAMSGTEVRPTSTRGANYR